MPFIPSALIIIDGVEYTEFLLENVNAQVISLQYIKLELARLEVPITVFKIAASGYGKALTEELSI